MCSPLLSGQISPDKIGFEGAEHDTNHPTIKANPNKFRMLIALFLCMIPQSKHFLDECDRLGLLVFEEIPGWQHVGDEYWKEIAINNVRDMIIEHRNHPSIIMWGVRINESGDFHDFYTKTNILAHECDPTRPTGGVRCFAHSELLEDKSNPLFNRSTQQRTTTGSTIKMMTTISGLLHGVISPNETI